MPKSNFRTVSFLILCLSFTNFCHGQDSLRTLKNERHFYKGKVFKAVYYNEKGQRTLDWENKTRFEEYPSYGLNLYSYNASENSNISTSFKVKIKNGEKPVLLREHGKPDGHISVTKTDSITGRTFTELYTFHLKSKRLKYSIEGILEQEFVSFFDKIDIRPCRLIVDSTQTFKSFRTEYEDGTLYLEEYKYDTLGNFIDGHNEIISINYKYRTEYTNQGNIKIRTFKTYQESEETNKLVSEQEQRSVYNSKKQLIEKEQYRTNIRTGKKKLIRKTEYQHIGMKLEKKRITLGRKEFLIEISKTYW